MMTREYNYRPPELTGEKLLQTFWLFQDEHDIPLTEDALNNFYLNAFIQTCSAAIPEEVSNPVFRIRNTSLIPHESATLLEKEKYEIRQKVSTLINNKPSPISTEPCFDSFYASVLESLIDGCEYIPDGIIEAIVIPRAGGRIQLDGGMEIDVPIIYLRIVE